MLLDDVRSFFAGRNFPLTWREETPGVRAILRPPQGQTLDLGEKEVGIVMPDVHLGWGNDVFRYNDPLRELRLERFLDELAALRDDRNGAVSVVQLGDWYDFWRAPGVTAASAKELIEKQYPGVAQRARDLPLLHCVGNHDANLAKAELESGLDVQIVRTIGKNSLLCFHSHDAISLAKIAVDGLFETIGLNLLNLVNSAPIIGAVSSFLQQVGDNSFKDPWADKSESLPWPAAKVSGPAGWSAPWVDRVDAVQLGAAIRAFELCVNEPVQVAIIGHSHRPGISWSPVGNRRVPVIDAGSWTYGRTEFVVVATDGIGIASLL